MLMALAIFSVSVFAQHEQYSKVKVFADETQLAELAKAGINVTEGFLKKDAFLVSDFSEQELLKIKDSGLNYEILIEDVSKYYADRNLGKSTNVKDYKGLSEWEVPENFEFGSMSGHATYDEVVAHLDNMGDLFPDLITAKESIGQSIEGRELWMVKVSDNPNVNETEPEILYTAIHHAREPAGVMQMIYYLYYLLENYDSDNFIKTLVDNTEMYFVPVVNPDGYVYNQTTNPNGGGMWRKNRRDNGGGSFGVDPNRNYGYMWGLNNQGSSPDPWDETYRGTAPFSEPEIAAIRDFCEAHEFRIALNYHTYSNLLLYTWGYTTEPCEDDAILEVYAELMTQDSHYTYGPGSTAIYETNGGSDDWMYGEQTTKDKTFSYTPELGGEDDGFWCAIDRIIPIAQENMIQNILAAALSGKYAKVEDLTPTITNDVTGYFKFELTRLGLLDCETFTVDLQPLDMVASTGDAIELQNMEIMEVIQDSIFYTLDASILSGTQFKFLLSVDNGEYVLSDTITKIFGETTVLFEDDCNTLTNWTSSVWDVTTSSYHSPTGSITDSPYGNYPNYHLSGITFNDEVDLTNAGFALLNFWGKWEIEQGWDYVQLMISVNGGSSWTPLAGNYTVIGNGYQAEGEPVYDGFQTSWVQEEIDLSDYIGTSVKFRFILKSDANVNEDGFYFDDFTISVVELTTTGEKEITVLHKSFSVSNPIPNPASKNVSFILTYPENADNLKFSIYNATGQIIHSELLGDGQKMQIINLNNWNPGIYYYQLEGNGVKTKAKKLVVIH